MEDNESQGIPLRRILLWGGAAFVSLGLLTGGGIYFWPKYKAWTSVRALQEAQEAQLAGEYRRQQLFLEQAVQMDASNLEARRQLALFCYQGGLPQAVPLWVALTEVEPGSIENHRGLVLALLRRGEVQEAAAALGRVPESLRETVEYRRLAAAVAMSRGDMKELEVQLEALARLETAPEGLRLSRAALALGSADPAQREAAWSELEALARRDEFRIRACLVLLKALPPTQPGVPPPAADLAERILGPRRAGSSLLPGVRRGLSDLVQHMMTQPSPIPEDAAELMQWMRLQGLAREALVWAAGQPAALRGSPRVLGQRAECALQLGQWRELRETVAAGVWGAIPEEAITLVFAARIQRDAGSVANSRATWADAAALAERNPAALRVLHRLAEGWGWRAEAERCLQQLVRNFPREDRLWVSLLHLAQAEGSADKTLQVLEAWSKAQGEPARVYSEWMLLAALLDHVEVDQQARLTEAAALPGASPMLRLAAALNACRKAGKGHVPVVPEGLEASSLTPRARLAWGILLLQAGKGEEARKAVAGLGQVAFLPEEKALLARVQELRPVF